MGPSAPAHPVTVSPAVLLLLLLLGLASANPRVAVTDIQNRTGDTTMDGAGAGLSGILLAKLVRVDNLEVVERAQLEAVLGELKLASTGAIDPATAAKAGKLLGATHMVMGELVSVKLPTIAVNLRVVEVDTGKVVAAIDVVGQVGEHGEEFFVLVDDATFRLVDALKVQLASRDRIELGQVDVQQLTTVSAYGRALEALDRGDKATAEAQLGKALSVEPGFKLAESTLTKLAADVASARTGYASAALTSAHADWEQLEKDVVGVLPPNPTVADLAKAAIRARMRLVRGDLDGYLKLEESRIAATTATHTKEAGAFVTALHATTTSAFVKRSTLYNLSVWPWETRLQMAGVLLMLGRKDAASALVIGNYQNPGPILSPSTRPRNPTEWADRHGLFDLAVVARKQALTQAQLRGDVEDTRRALTELDEAITEAREAHEARADWDAIQPRLSATKADKKLLDDELRALRVTEDDRTLVLTGYQAFQRRAKAGFYDAVRTDSDFEDLADKWRQRADHLWDDNWFADQRLGNLLDYQAIVPARDAEAEARRKKALDDFASGAYGR